MRSGWERSRRGSKVLICGTQILLYASADCKLLATCFFECASAARRAAPSQCSGVALGMDEARQTLLDNDGPLVKFNGSTGKWCCMLCKRQFPAEKQLEKHLMASDLHKTNLAAAVASGRIIRSSGAPSASSGADTATDDGRKRAREHDDVEKCPPNQRRSSSLTVLHQMEEFERALQGRSGASSGGGGGGGGKEPLYRDRAKERRETQGSTRQHADATGLRSARDINGNLDWRCGHCNKLNFARELACISCMREVDEESEYAKERCSRSAGLVRTPPDTLCTCMHMHMHMSAS